MKLYRPVLEGVVGCLLSIFNEGRYADKVLEYFFKKNRKWGGRDRKLIASSVYDLVRWSRRYLDCIGVHWSDDNFVFYKTEEAKAAIDEKVAWQMIYAWLSLKGVELPEWGPYQESFRKDRFLERWNNKEYANRAIKVSVPDWLFEVGASSLGEEKWLKELSAMNQVASIFLRTNTLKIDRKKLIQNLANEGIQVKPISTNEIGLKVLEEDGVRPNVFKTDSFKMGCFEVQDGGSQGIGRYVEVQPGWRVIDACAGAGGKTLQLAAEMKNKGRIISMDVDERKLLELKQRARRGGVDIVETKKIESSKTIKRLNDSADFLLLDVPCSGLGVLKRNPDTKWRLTPPRLEELINIQKDILFRYSKMVKPGGVMVYATCSVLPAENIDQVSSFVEQAQGEWELLDSQQIWPSETEFDGFFMAKLKRKN